jgi:hypothetical protein
MVMIEAEQPASKPKRVYKRRNLRRLRYSRAGILQPELDGRTREARRYYRLGDELAAGLEADLGRPLTPSERIEVAQAVKLLVLSQAESNVSTAIRLSSEARRLLEGIKPKVAKGKPKGDVALKAYVAERYGAPEDATESA